MELNKEALDRITNCFCSCYTCATCPLPTDDDGTRLCYFYDSNNPTEQKRLLEACKKYGDDALFEHLDPAYKALLKNVGKVI